jgi:hypothetical protein
VSDAYQDKTAKESFMEGFCTGISVVKTVGSKSFYAEFTDFDINRCDDWVKENIISKLTLTDRNDETIEYDGENGLKYIIKANTETIKRELNDYLRNFRDYQIQFVIDSDYWGWCKFLELIGEWEEKEKGYCSRCGYDYSIDKIKVGSPKLPSNISPFPVDLTTLGYEKELSENTYLELGLRMMVEKIENQNALWDAGIIKDIYNNLMIEK